MMLSRLVSDFPKKVAVLLVLIALPVVAVTSPRPIIAAVAAAGYSFAIAKLVFEAHTAIRRIDRRHADLTERGSKQLGVIEVRLAELSDALERLGVEVGAAGRERSDLVADVSSLRADLHAARADLSRHREAHAGDADISRLVRMLDDWVVQRRADRRLAPSGEYGPPERRHAAALAALRQRMVPEE